jgi:hypothetical protein
MFACGCHAYTQNRKPLTQKPIGSIEDTVIDKHIKYFDTYKSKVTEHNVNYYVY